MKLLLDTHVFLLAVADPARLPQGVSKALLSDDNSLWVSVASLWEITLKAATGKQIQWLDRTPPEVLESYVRRLGANQLHITAQHVVETWNVRDWPNRDPFDRMLATQARVENAVLVTADESLRACAGVQTLWD